LLGEVLDLTEWLGSLF